MTLSKTILLVTLIILRSQKKLTQMGETSMLKTFSSVHVNLHKALVTSK